MTRVMGHILREFDKGDNVCFPAYKVHSEKQSTPNGKNWLSKGSKFFLFRINYFLERRKTIDIDFPILSEIEYVPLKLLLRSPLLPQRDENSH